MFNVEIDNWPRNHTSHKKKYFYEFVAKVFFRSPGIYTKEVKVPSDPTLKQGYWLVGCFDGLNGISNFNVKNVLLFNNPNGQPNLCD